MREPITPHKERGVWASKGPDGNTWAGDTKCGSEKRVSGGVREGFVGEFSSLLFKVL